MGSSRKLVMQGSGAYFAVVCLFAEPLSTFFQWFCQRRECGSSCVLILILVGWYHVKSPDIFFLPVLARNIQWITCVKTVPI